MVEFLNISRGKLLPKLLTFFCYMLLKLVGTGTEEVIVYYILDVFKNVKVEFLSSNLLFNEPEMEPIFELENLFLQSIVVNYLKIGTF